MIKLILMKEIDQRFNILSGATSQLDDPRSPRHFDWRIYGFS